MTDDRKVLTALAKIHSLVVELGTAAEEFRLYPDRARQAYGEQGIKLLTDFCLEVIIDLEEIFREKPTT